VNKIVDVIEKPLVFRLGERPALCRGVLATTSTPVVRTPIINIM
jgi:hypothetical protein